MFKARRHPDNTLEDALRERGYTLQRNWRIKGPMGTEIAWMEHLLVSGDRGEWGTMIVQTFKTAGWNVYVTPTASNDIEETIEAVIRAITPKR